MTWNWDVGVVTVPLPLLVTSHLVFGLLVYGVTIRIGERAMDLPHERYGKMSGLKSLSARSRLALTFMVVAAVFIGMAIQQFAFQSDTKSSNAAQDRVIRCVQRWGNQFAKSLQTRSEQSKKVRDAQDLVDQAKIAKETALDDIINTVVLLREVPPVVPEQSFDTALARYQLAKTRLDRASHALRRAVHVQETVADKNPYKAPKVVCKNSGGND